jgi:hypothetical protein
LSACDVSVCTENRTTSEWVLQTGVVAILAGGNALDFIGSLNFSFDEYTGVTETYTVPFRVKGNEGRKGSNVIKTGTMTSVGGSYIELKEDQTTGGVGEVNLNGQMVQAARVSSIIPAVCQP